MLKKLLVAGIFGSFLAPNIGAKQTRVPINTEGTRQKVACIIQVLDRSDELEAKLRNIRANMKEDRVLGLVGQIKRGETPSLFQSLEKMHPYVIRVIKIMDDGKAVPLSWELSTLPSDSSVENVDIDFYFETNSIRRYARCRDD